MISSFSAREICAFVGSGVNSGTLQIVSLREVAASNMYLGDSTAKVQKVSTFLCDVELPQSCFPSKLLIP